MAQIKLFDKDIAREVAKMLLSIKAVELRPDDPFKWASGRWSPIYCDNRKALSSPPAREIILSSFCYKIIFKAYANVGQIGGVATAAIAWGILIADKAKMGYFYIRSSKKDHGQENLIEGEVMQHAQTLIIEDLISTGGSSLKAAAAAKEAGANVIGMLAIFSYQLAKANEAFAGEEYPVYVLCDYPTLVEVAVKEEYVTENQKELLDAWYKDPAAWSEAAEKRKANQTL